jgi:hypothetical protein
MPAEQSPGEYLAKPSEGPFAMATIWDLVSGQIPPVAAR